MVGGRHRPAPDDVRATRGDLVGPPRRAARHRGEGRPLDFGAMPTFKSPRGTRDLLPPETAAWTRLERLAADLAARYGYRRIETPLFELTDVFERGVGEVTDIVEKELYRLAPTDRGRRVVGAPARADRRDRARLRPARDADLAAAGQADRDRPDVPLRPPAGGSLPPVLAVGRRGHRRSRAGRRRRADRARHALLPRGRPRRASWSISTRSAIRPAGPPTSRS